MRGRGTRLRTVALSGVVVLLGVLPLLAVAWRAARGGVFLESIRRPGAVEALGNTAALAVLTTLLAVVVGTGLAWVLMRTTCPGRRSLSRLLTIPYVIPPYILAVAWIHLANPRVGFLNRVFGAGTFDVYGLGGLVWVLGLAFYPYVFLTVSSALTHADPSLEDAARMSGAGPWRVWRDVSLPLMRPAILSSAGLVFMATASAFGAPVLIGGPARFEVLSTRIFETVSGGAGGVAEASSLATLLLAFGCVPLLLGARHHAVLTGKTSPATRVRLGRARVPVFVGLVVFAVVAVLLPTLAVVTSAFLSVAGDLSPANWTLANLRVLEAPETLEAIGTSLLLAGGAATAAVALGAGISFLRLRAKARGAGLLALLAGLPLAVPGTVLALGLVLVWSSPFALRGTLILIGIAYVAKFTALAMRAIDAGVGTIDDALPDAARLSGARGPFLFATIWWPLLLPALAAAWFLVFVPAFSELTMSVLLKGPGIETVGTRLFELQEYEAPTAASVLASVVLVVVLAGRACARALARRFAT